LHHGATMVLETLLKRIKERNHRGIVNQTEKLDPQTRQQLQEFLEVVPGEQKELEDLEEELWDASAKLNEMVEKEEFIGIRLKAYQNKLEEMAHGCDSTPPATSEADSDDDEEEEEGAGGGAGGGRSERESGSCDEEQPSSMGNSAKQNKQKEHQEALAKVQQIHNDMKVSIQTFKKKIAKMEKRKCQLRLHLEECQVFLETAEGWKDWKPNWPWKKQQLKTATMGRFPSMLPRRNRWHHRRNLRKMKRSVTFSIPHLALLISKKKKKTMLEEERVTRREMRWRRE